MSTLPTAKQKLRRVIVGLFPWLPGVVSVAGEKGKGLAIRAAGGLLHLAGGPADPAVFRTGDYGTAGSITASANTVTIRNAKNELFTLTFTIAGGAIAIVPSPLTPAFDIAIQAGPGSEKVTCA